MVHVLVVLRALHEAVRDEERSEGLGVDHLHGLELALPAMEHLLHLRAAAAAGARRGPRRRRGRGVRRGVMRGGDGEVSGKAREGTLVGTRRGNSPARAIAPGERARREPPPRDGSAGRRKKRRARERSTRAPGRRWRGHPRGSRGTSCRCRTRSRRCLPCWPWWRVSDVCVTRARGWPKRGLELGQADPEFLLSLCSEEHPRVSNAFPRTKTGFWGGRGNASPGRIWLARALGR